MLVFFLNDTATTEIYTRSIVGSVRCVQETGYVNGSLGYSCFLADLKFILSLPFLFLIFGRIDFFVDKYVRTLRKGRFQCSWLILTYLSGICGENEKAFKTIETFERFALSVVTYMELVQGIRKIVILRNKKRPSAKMLKALLALG
eukprot:TRINITY_DN51213_c0_g1_i2.p2 TRINITY_DN51213_c0_g1~~TRINITY_DN51213_c0_g1_i2.p2  ORF type:complete len:146 (+),score=22.25 TRINITY_DN51213_c0_g1_i2:47-484(+)